MKKVISRLAGLSALTTLIVSLSLPFPAQAQAQAQTLRIGLQEDPDMLDPTLARTFVSRIVFATLCDKLVDITPDLQIVPQLATSWSWSGEGKVLTMALRPGVKFHDGEPMDAEAVRYSLDRHLNMPESRRRSEISPITAIEVVDPLSVRITLNAPFSPLIAQLADRAGMIISPKAAKAAGTSFGLRPVCAGPYKFVERVTQDRIVVERFADYWDKNAVTFPQITYLPIPDTTVRLANLQAGQLDLVERLSPSDMASIRSDRRFAVAAVTSLGYQTIAFNTGNGDKAKNPFAVDARLRQALNWAIDRTVINKVAFEGMFTEGNQFVAPESPYYNRSFPIAGRDVGKAKALLKEAGANNPVLTLLVPNNNEALQTAQIIQSMAQEAGIVIKISAIEFASMLAEATRGNFEAELVGWSGRVDPDGNIYAAAICDGSFNDGHYCNPAVDKLLEAARKTGDFEMRKKLYDQATEIYMQDVPRLFLYHPKLLYAFTSRLDGFKPYPDGLIRVQGMRFKNG
jgi:peptide/nickel transport system substrate-binding protein